MPASGNSDPGYADGVLSFMIGVKVLPMPPFVAHDFILRNVGQLDAPTCFRRPADWKSAIQQIENLRYVTVFASRSI